MKRKEISYWEHKGGDGYYRHIIRCKGNTPIEFRCFYDMSEPRPTGWDSWTKVRRRGSLYYQFVDRKIVYTKVEEADIVLEML